MLGKMEKGNWKMAWPRRRSLPVLWFPFSIFQFRFSKSLVGRSVFELLDIALLDLLHESLAVNKIAFQVDGQLAGNDENLIVGDLREGDRAAWGNQVRAPLEHESRVPQHKEK